MNTKLQHDDPGKEFVVEQDNLQKNKQKQWVRSRHDIATIVNKP
jgi:hypothetical protein